MSYSLDQNQDNSPIKNIVIVGADVVGWCAAVGLARGLQGQKVNITVIDLPTTHSNMDAVIHASDHLFDFHRLFGIQDKPLLVSGEAKLCTGAQFINFAQLHPDYFIGCDKTQASFCTVELHHVMHWLGIENISSYSLSGIATENSLLAIPTNDKDVITAGFSPSVNLNAQSYLTFMQGAASHLGVKSIKKTIHNVHYHSENGFISHFEFENGQTLLADLVLNNSGNEELFGDVANPHNKVDCSAYMPFDKKISAHATIINQAKPYQQFIATACGLVEINRMSHVHHINMHYASQTTTDVEAQQQLTKLLPTIQNIKIAKVQIAYSANTLFKNCFALGENAGYLGTSPFSTLLQCQRSISKLLELFPGKACLLANSKELNRRINKDYQQALDYSLLMFIFYEENLGKFDWQLGLQQLPESLRRKIELFSSGGRVGSELNPLVSRDGWINLLKYKVRQRQGYEPVLDALDKENAKQFLQQLSYKIQKSLKHYRPYN
jgi:tryptophan halogenase